MAIQHPLLEAPKTTTSQCKPLYLILCLAAIISSTTLVSFHVMNKITSSSDPSLTHICDQDNDQESCLSILSEIPYHKTKPMSGAVLLQAVLQKSTLELQKALEFSKVAYSRINNPRGQTGIADCVELMDMAIDRVMDSIIALQKFGEKNYYPLDDVHTWLSGVLTDHVTCMDGLEGSTRTMMEPMLNDLISRSRACLAIVVTISDPSKPKPIDEKLNEDFPSWVTRMDIRLFQGSDLPKEITPNAVVAQDGSGKHTTITEAVAAAPDNSNTRYIILVKKGTYEENVVIGKNKMNLMLVGEGMDNTIITGNRNQVDGASVLKSATLAADGDHFMAQDMYVKNTAGPGKQQAVALRVSGDKSVIYRCRVDAYQDTLYAQKNKQFYRDSYITGTVDFIFGDASVVFQNCIIVPRKPGPGQMNMITAQGRTAKTQNSGTSIQKCKIVASDDLKPVQMSVQTFLGRPWKEYSRTVVMQSRISHVINSTGWHPWNNSNFALDTLYFGEYANEGPGAGLANRVKWRTFHNITDPNEAKKFTVSQLIQGGTWLKAAGVAYIEGLF